ncbi:hypothetical protein MBLNU230_g1318t1 [Neophaeotheca triangularis]
MERPAKRSRLECTLAATLDKRRSNSTIRNLTTNAPDSVDFSSNDFLSLAKSKDLHTAFLEELHKFPHYNSLGSGGSRLLDGNSTYAEKLEKDIASFHRAETGLLCNSGFDANVGLFSCLPQRGDVVVYDEYIHASVHDGMRLSRASRCVKFDHNDLESFERILRSSDVGGDAAVRDGKKSVFVAVEAVYSMDGDIAPLREMKRVLDEILPGGNGYLIVDEAHSTGVLGPRGSGLVCDLNMENDVLVRLHTFGKGLACNGAILLASPLIRQYMVNYARPLIYTTFMSYPALAAIRASYSFLMSGRTESLAQNLHSLTSQLHGQLTTLINHLDIPSPLSHLLRLPLSQPQYSPIFSLLSSQPKDLAAHCQRRGFVVRGIVPPTVPAGAERVRICLHAGNSTEEVKALVSCIGQWADAQIKGREETVKLEEAPRARL